VAGPGQRHSVTIETDASGDATAVVSGKSLNRDLFAIVYTADDYAATATFTITAKETGIQLWQESNVSASKTVHPLAPGFDQAGNAFAGVTAGPVPLCDEDVLIVVASGGNTKSGTFTIVLR
jgi:hypothetical protein